MWFYIRVLVKVRLQGSVITRLVVFSDLCFPHLAMFGIQKCRFWYRIDITEKNSIRKQKNEKNEKKREKKNEVYTSSILKDSLSHS